MLWRPRIRFRLATLLIAVTAICVWLGMIADRAYLRKSGVERVEKLGGAVFFDHQKERRERLPPNIKTHHSFDHTAPPPGPDWVRRWLGEEFLSKPCSIRLWDARLTDDDLRVISGMVELEEIELYRVDLSAVSLQPLIRLKRLSWLLLNECTLGPATLAPIGRLSKLEYLELTDMPLTDAQVPPLSDLISLNMLRVTGTKLTGSGFGDLNKLSKFSMLCATDTPFDDRGLEAIGTLPVAGTLFLEGTAITDRGLAHLADMASLERLDLDRNALSDAGLVHLSGLTSLRILGLTDTHIQGTAVALECLHGLDKLEYLLLDVAHGKEPDAAVARLRQALPRCQIMCRRREPRVEAEP